MRVRSSARRASFARCRTHGSDELRERFLPPLLETDYDRAQRGAQFLTERHGGLGRRREPGRGDPGRRRLAPARGEVVLLGRGRRPVPRDRPAAGRAGGDPRDRLLPRASLGRRLPDPPAEGQARDARARDRGDRVRWRCRVCARAAGGRLPNRSRRAEHLPLAERARLGRADAPRVPRGVGVRPRARGVRPRRSRTIPSSARTWR